MCLRRYARSVSVALEVPTPESDVALIVNVKSGSRQQQVHRHLTSLLAERDIRADISVARSGSQVRTYARAAAESGYRTIVAAGGDGTVSAVAGQVLGTPAVLGVLPLGTFNHFARDLGLPMELGDAVAVIGRGKVLTVDAAEVNGHVFVNNSSIGLYPHLVVERERHRRLGYARWMALLAAILSCLRRFGFVQVKIEAETLQYEGATPFLFVGNNMYTLSGLRLGSREHLDEAKLFVCLARRVGRLALLRMAIEALIGTLKHDADFDVISTTELWVRPRWRPLRVSLDGEVVHIRGPLHYRTVPGALRVLVP